MRLLYLTIALACTSCLSGSWRREERFAPIREETVAQLAPGDSLGRCLELLGAPVRLWEVPGGGMALGYGSGVAHDIGLSISRSNASFNFDSLDQNFEGVVLMFSPDLELRWMGRGVLSELARSGRRRPELIDDGAVRE